MPTPVSALLLTWLSINGASRHSWPPVDGGSTCSVTAVPLASRATQSTGRFQVSLVYGAAASGPWIIAP